MRQHILIAPSLLGADLSRIGEEIKAVERAGADWLHIDVMDGNFVPPISFGEIIVANIRGITKLSLDTHLMITAPEKHIASFKDAGSDIITIHFEATADPRSVLQLIRANGLKCGLSLKPRTSIEQVFPLLDLCDLVLVMSVEPGWGGQSFLKESPERIAKLRTEIDRRGLDVIIQVDGGLRTETALLCRNAGVDCIVAGTFIFRHRDKKLAIASLRGE